MNKRRSIIFTHLDKTVLIKGLYPHIRGLLDCADPLCETGSKCIKHNFLNSKIAKEIMDFGNNVKERRMCLFRIL
jgi:hypothetical protein